MAFSDQFLEELRARAGLADVVGRRVKLQRKGREHLGLCPFHKEKTPSFTVNEEKGFYHCFGCGAHGSVFDFVMQTEGLSFPEAVEKLAGEAGIDIPRDTPEEQERQRQRQTLYDVAEQAAVFFERQLRMPEGRRALDYLKSRGLDDAWGSGAGPRQHGVHQPHLHELHRPTGRLRALQRLRHPLGVVRTHHVHSELLGPDDAVQLAG